MATRKNSAKRTANRTKRIKKLEAEIKKAETVVSRLKDRLHILLAEESDEDMRSRSVGFDILSGTEVPLEKFPLFGHSGPYDSY